MECVLNLHFTDDLFIISPIYISPAELQEATALNIICKKHYIRMFNVHSLLKNTSNI